MCSINYIYIYIQNDLTLSHVMLGILASNEYDFLMQYLLKTCMYVLCILWMTFYKCYINKPIKYTVLHHRWKINYFELGQMRFCFCLSCHRSEREATDSQGYIHERKRAVQGQLKMQKGSELSRADKYRRKRHLGQGFVHETEK